MKWLLILLVAIMVSCGSEIQEVAHVKIVTVSINTERMYTEVVYANHATDEVRRADIQLYYANAELLQEFQENIGAIYEITIKARTITHAKLIEPATKGR